MGLVGLALVFLWPEKKWIGWAALILAFLLVVGWFVLERKASAEKVLSNRASASLSRPQMKLFVSRCGYYLRAHMADVQGALAASENPSRALERGIAIRQRIVLVAHLHVSSCGPTVFSLPKASLKVTLDGEELQPEPINLGAFRWVNTESVPHFGLLKHVNVPEELRDFTDHRDHRFQEGDSKDGWVAAVVAAPRPVIVERDLVVRVAVRDSAGEVHHVRIDAAQLKNAKELTVSERAESESQSW